MTLPDHFKYFINSNKLFNPKDTVLLAVSGGMDSIVMTELFREAKYKFKIAHCNFQLRSKESDEDEKFVKRLAKRYKVKFYSKRFNTEQYATENNLSIQVAARNLRYEWFNELIKKGKYKYIATAHHLDDSIETFFINLLRGTGVEGLTGIKSKRETIIRPLLFAAREEIESFIKNNKLAYREDSSNGSDDYLRNRIRHHLIPLMKQLNPQFEQIMQGNFSRISFAEHIVSIYINDKEKAIKSAEKHLSISITDLKKEKHPEQVLFHLFNKYDFNIAQCREMLKDATSGKQFYSKDYCVLRNRGKLLLSKRMSEEKDEYRVRNTTKLIKVSRGELKTSSLIKTRQFNVRTPNGAQYLDNALLKFPLTLRKWRPGDYFYPLGMNHRKKLSNFFIDQKSNLFEKERIYVLISDDEIVCILGHRIDDRFKVTNKTRKIYKVQMKYY